VLLVLLFTLLLPLCSCAGRFDYRGEGLLTVHFLDVGQSDCTFIEVGGEFTLMIDAADAAHADKVVRYVRSLGYETIDALVLTHPHSDHIGGAEKVIESFYVKSVYMTSETGDEPYYSALLGAVEKNSLKTVTAERGGELSLGELNGTFLAPSDKRFADENDMSAVLSLGYGDIRLLFMGDAGADAESELLDSGAELSAHVVKAGHHGSNGSSSSEFIGATGATYVVFSCGIDNDFGHPSVYAVDRWESGGARCFRTDLDSTVLLCTDGEGIAAGSIEDSGFWRNARMILPAVSSDGDHSDSAKQEKYILDTETHTVHVRGCYKALRLPEIRAEHTSAEIDRLLAEGYEKCRCFD
jgi:beta-lactamase superfamily II metal-dependent hydrolase